MDLVSKNRLKCEEIPGINLIFNYNNPNPNPNPKNNFNEIHIS